MNEGCNVIVQHSEISAEVHIWIIFQQGEEHYVVNPLNMTQTTTIGRDNWETPPPTIRIDSRHARGFLSGLADGLVAAGYRPDELKAKDQELVALKEHLEDMRTLVFQALLPPEVAPQYIRGDK